MAMQAQDSVMAMQAQDSVPSTGNFEPSLWGFSFASFSFPQSEFESYSKEVELLKEKVKDMLRQSERNPIENIELIDLLSRLGLSYHFENEIEKQLNQIYFTLDDLFDDNDYNLYTTTLIFQIFRQSGFYVSCDVFKKFKSYNGEFNKAMENDVKGILGLYEAAFLRMHGEDILDQALAFTRPILETFVAAQSSTVLAKRVENALSLTFYQSIEIVEARKYISFYEEIENPNKTLLKLTKFNFNMLQLLYKQELALLSRWWKDINLVEKLPYARNRIVEGYFWVVGAHFEPQYALARQMMVKFGLLITLLDDTYDTHATFKELQILTAAFDRCSIDAINQLPEYLKALFSAFLNLLEETKIYDDDGKNYRSFYMKDILQKFVRSNFNEAKWFNEGYVPLFDEYMSIRLTSAGYSLLSAASFVGMRSTGIKEYEWAISNPKILQAVSTFIRLMNDISGLKDEYKRPRECPSSVECYMKQYGVSAKMAIRKFQEMCVNAWKDINEEIIKSNAVSKKLLRYFLNLARVVNFLYSDKDLFTHPSGLKDVITLLFEDQFPVYE